MTKQPAERSAVSGVVVADNEQRLRQQINQTRQELGDTVAELAAKADVKRQIQARSAGVKRQVQARRAAMASRVKAGAKPEAMRYTAMQGVSTARRRPRPLIAAAGTAGVVGLALLWWNQRRSASRKR